MLRTKNVWSAANRKTDGLRIRVTRFRGRGMLASRYDVWMPNLGPSDRLLSAFQDGTVSWPQFSRAYRKELDRQARRAITHNGQKSTLRLVKQLALGGRVTLLCHLRRGSAAVP